MNYLYKNFHLYSDKLEELSPKGIWYNQITMKPHLMLLYRMIEKAIQALLEKKYLDFDAQTTSHCCHGVAAWVSHLIPLALCIDLKEIQNILPLKLHELKCYKNENIKTLFPSEFPMEIFHLASLYMLSFATEISPTNGKRTVPSKLKTLFPVGTTFSSKIIHTLQKYYSNTVAHSYHLYSQCVDQDKSVNGVPLKVWSKYVEPNALRKDNRGILYTSALYSMQVLLSYLIQTKRKIAFINDLNNKHRQFRNRYIRVLEGDGNQNFKEVPESFYNRIEGEEPIILFGGVTFSDNIAPEELAILLDEWIFKFPELILAGYLSYPQFPGISYDPTFDFSPIVPDEESIVYAIQGKSSVIGVSLEDPSLSYLAHVCLLSFNEVLLAKENRQIGALPNSAIYMPIQ